MTLDGDKVDQKTHNTSLMDLSIEVSIFDKNLKIINNNPNIMNLK